MKRKEVEDVIGGKDAWENVDKADGEFCGIWILAVVLLRRGVGGAWYIRSGRTEERRGGMEPGEQRPLRFISTATRTPSFPNPSLSNNPSPTLSPPPLSSTINTR